MDATLDMPARGAAGAALETNAATSAGPASLFGAAWTGATDTSTGGGLPSIEGYDVVRRIGQGGMGMVFEGVQQATGRRVAIKILPEHTLGSETARRRFEREVDVVASLAHPGIIPIVDSGVRRGRYYYVMEYVDGRPLDAAYAPGACDLGAALRAVAEVCDAVDYAHQRAVLHRDLKPSNILVDASGRTRLLDFGLAKQTGADEGNQQRAELTIAGEGAVLGTIAYMSPEQASGHGDEASVRADVYSLGVIAYQLVTGRLPVPIEGSLRDVLVWITEREPAAPSSIVRKLSKDLDAVLLKALEKDPKRRYATAGELAEDIRRYLGNEPVLARRVGPAGRLVRWARRNRAVATTIAAAAGTLITISTIMIAQIIEQRDIAQANFKRAETLLGEREAALEESRRNERFAQQNFNVIANLLRTARSDREVSLREFMDEAVNNLDTNPPESRRTDAAIRELIGQAYRGLGEHEKAARQLELSYTYRDENDKTFSDTERADALHARAASLWWMGRYAQAEPLYRQSLALRRKVSGGQDTRDIATSLTHLAACRLRMGFADEARGYYEQALEMRLRLFGPEHPEVAAALNNLAKYYWEVEDDQRAEALFRQALDMNIKLRGEDDLGTASGSVNLALYLLERGDAQRAEPLVQRALNIRQTRYPNGHPLTATAHAAMARVQLALGNVPGAADHAGRALELYRLLRFGRRDYAEVISVMGRVRLAQGDLSDARTALDEAHALLAAGSPPAALELAEVESDQAELLAREGKTEQARVLFDGAVARAKEFRGENSRVTRDLARRARTVLEGTAAR